MNIFDILKSSHYLLFFVLGMFWEIIMVLTIEKKEKIIETLGNCGDISNGKEHFIKMEELRKKFDDDGQKNSMVEVFEALGNKDRFIILDALKEKDRCVCELEAILGKSQGTVSRQLKILSDVGLIQGWAKGKFTHYSLRRKTLEEFTNQWQSWCEKISNWLSEI